MAKFVATFVDIFLAALDPSLGHLSPRRHPCNQNAFLILGAPGQSHCLFYCLKTRGGQAAISKLV
jgi:hypothetical protein